MSINVTNIATFAPTANAAISRNSKSNATPAATTKAAALSPEELNKAVNMGNAIFQADQRELIMNVDQETQRVVVKIVDRSTGDVIRQLPTKEVLNFIKAMQENASSSGSLIKSSA